MSKVFKIPDGTRVYAIGDIHGYVEVLGKLHEKIDADLRERPIDQAVIVYLGDYIDRGPDSKGVIDHLITREIDVPQLRPIYLLGNHEDAMFNEFMNDPKGHRQDWLHWGGVECAQSYGVNIDPVAPIDLQAEDIAAALRDALPLTHQEFYKNLSLYYIEGDYLFVHAGIRPDVPMDEQTKQDLTFTRQPFMSHEAYHPYYVVHGHTAMRNHQVDIRPNRMNLDTGLYEGGPLSCGVFEGNDVRVLQEEGDEKRV